MGHQLVAGQAVGVFLGGPAGSPEGIGVAVANSEPEVLNCADIIAPSNEEDGVAQVIESYIAQGKIGAMKQ